MEGSEKAPARALKLALLLLALALPAWANNPPRPDGVLYLILVFPLAAMGRYLAGAEVPRRRLGWRVARGVFYVFTVLLAAAGTGLGLLAMVVIVAYGLARAVEILRRGQRARKLALAALVAVSTLAAAAGYLWAVGAGSAETLARARQKRTIADLRNSGLAVMSWCIDQGLGDLEAAAGASGTPQALAFDGPGSPAPISHAALEALLVPDYTSDLPLLDGWRHPYEHRLDRERCRFWIRSGGDDRDFESGPYARGPFDPADRHRDIVWAEGEFWQWPDPSVRTGS